MTAATETKVESGTSQSKSGTYVNLSNNGESHFTTQSTSKVDSHLKKTRQTSKDWSHSWGGMGYSGKRARKGKHETPVPAFFSRVDSSRIYKIKTENMEQ